MSETIGNTRRSLALILLAGLAVRLALAPTFGGFGYDMDVLRNWAQTLSDQPLRRFYDVAMAPDHLPGDLWFLVALVHLFQALGGTDLHGAPFLMALKSIPAVADLLVGMAMFAIVARYRSDSTALGATAFYVFNPATVFLTSVWGQWDAVSCALLLAAFILMLRSSWGWIWAAPFLAWAVVIKPPLALVGLVLCLMPIVRFMRSRDTTGKRLATMLTQFALAALIGLATVVIIILPFDVGLPGMGARWSLLHRISVALDLYPHTTLGAFNVWMIPLGSLERVSDLERAFLGVSAHRWGSIMLATGLLYVSALLLWSLRNHPVQEVVSWGSVAVSFAVFMLPTRVHERYLFPAIAFVILFAALRGFPRDLVILAGTLSLSFFFNLLSVYGGYRALLPDPIAEFTVGFLFRAGSVVNVALFAWVLALPWSGRAFSALIEHPQVADNPGICVRMRD